MELVKKPKTEKLSSNEQHGEKKTMTNNGYMQQGRGRTEREMEGIKRETEKRKNVIKICNAFFFSFTVAFSVYIFRSALFVMKKQQCRWCVAMHK